MKNWLFALLLLTIGFSMGCFESSDAPDVSDIDFTLHRIDFDDLFLSLGTGDILDSDLSVLRDEHPEMTEIYIRNIMQFQRPLDTTDLYLTDIRGFLTSEHPQALKAKVDSVFGDRTNLDKEFTKAFQYLKYYFPELDAPSIYYLMTEYSYASFIFPTNEGDALGVSLDMFLGKDYPYKSIFPTNPAFSDYLTRTFTPEYVVKKSLDVLIDDLVGNPSGPRMIDQMIKNGKQQYILEKLLPTAPDSVRWEFTSDQMQWVNDNELNIYAYLTSEDLLYSTDELKFQKFVSPSPTSPGMPPESPGRTANYIGYKIIQAYVYKTGASLEELVLEMDTQSIINTARYRPDI